MYHIGNGSGNPIHCQVVAQALGPIGIGLICIGPVCIGPICICLLISFGVVVLIGLGSVLDMPLWTPVELCHLARGLSIVQHNGLCPILLA